MKFEKLIFFSIYPLILLVAIAALTMIGCRQPTGPSVPRIERVTDINAGAGDSSPADLISYNTKLYFSADDGTYGRELYEFDGTTATRITDVNTIGTSLSTPDRFAVYNSALYFAASDSGTYGRELYEYDGATVTRVTDINTSGDSVSLPSYLVVYNDNLYFGATDGSDGQELYVYDGSTATRVADINTGIGNSNPSYLTVYNGKLYFSADDGSGRTLWVHEDTGPSTTQILALNLPAHMEVYSSELYMGAYEVADYELYKYDGSTHQLAANISPGGSSFPSFLIEFGSFLCFRANDGSAGCELYRYDGSAAIRVADINPGAGDGLPSTTYFSVYNNTLYFPADDGTPDIELYKYDGSTISLVEDINPGGSSNPQHLYVWDGKLYFQADDGTDGAELWVYYLE